MTRSRAPSPGSSEFPVHLRSRDATNPRFCRAHAYARLVLTFPWAPSMFLLRISARSIRDAPLSAFRPLHMNAWIAMLGAHFRHDPEDSHAPQIHRPQPLIHDTVRSARRKAFVPYALSGYRAGPRHRPDATKRGTGNGGRAGIAAGPRPKTRLLNGGRASLPSNRMASRKSGAQARPAFARRASTRAIRSLRGTA